MASTAVVIAVGVNAQSGEREVLGFDVGPSEDGAFWSAFSALFGRPRALWSEARNQRRSPGLEERRCGGPGRRLLAEVPGSFHEECSVTGAQGGPADGGRNHPHRLRPARCRERPPAVAKGLRGLPSIGSRDSRS